MGKIKELPAYKLANGTVYTGDWKDDFQHGKGKEVLPNGDEYDGNYDMGV